LNRRVIQIIAYVTMMIDHLAASLSITWWKIWESTASYNFYTFLRGVGRMAFPLFIFGLVNGVRHTRSLPKYLLRIAVFAVISELPFDFALFGKVWTVGHQNVMLTLLIGLLVLVIIRWGLHRKGWELLYGIPAAIAITLGGMTLAEFLNTDYGAGGILAIAVMGAVLLNPLTERVTVYPANAFIRAGAMAATVTVLGLMCGSGEFVAMLMVIPAFLYQETAVVRPRRSLFLSNYMIYPAHLALYALAIVLPYVLTMGRPVF
jgi:hypothetical protein